MNGETIHCSVFETMETKDSNNRQVITVSQDFSTEENAFVPIDAPFDIDKHDLEVIDYFIKLQVESNSTRFVTTLIYNRRAIIGICGNKERRVCRLNIPPFCGDIPKSVLRLDALQILNLRYCESIPQWITEFKNLKKIVLPENTTDVPDFISELTGLKELDLSRSKIPSLPPSIGQLKHLEKLNLFLTRKLLTLPEEIGGLGNLVQIKLRDSSVSSLPSPIGRLQNLKELDLSMAIYFSGLPEEIGNLCDLVTLNLSHTPISSLPPSIGSLRSLKVLDLCGTWKFKNLPKEIGGLENLTHLTLTFSPIASLPSSIGRLKSLQDFDLCNTESLTSLPKELGGLDNLIHLKLNQSSISSIPASIGQLQKLEELNLLHTDRLLHIPEEIGDLANLKRISVFGSNIVNVARKELWCKMAIRRARLRRNLGRSAMDESFPTTRKIQLPILLERARDAFNGKWIEVAPEQYMEPLSAQDAIYQILIDSGIHLTN